MPPVLTSNALSVLFLNAFWHKLPFNLGWEYKRSEFMGSLQLLHFSVIGKRCFLILPKESALQKREKVFDDSALSPKGVTNFYTWQEKVDITDVPQFFHPLSPLTRKSNIWAELRLQFIYGSKRTKKLLQSKWVFPVLSLHNSGWRKGRPMLLSFLHNVFIRSGFLVLPVFLYYQP